MQNEKIDEPVEVRIFGALRNHMNRQNLPYILKKDMPEGALTPMDIAKELNIPIHFFSKRPMITS